MEKYFLGSVGKAEAFRKNAQGKMELAFVSKTLTDSGLNISTTKDDIRAGQGAPIQFSFYHDPSVEITLTDVLWKKDYLTAQLGANFEASTDAYVTKEVTLVNGEAALENVQKVPLPCGEDYLIWICEQGKDNWDMAEYDATNKKVKYGTRAGKFCVRYLSSAESSKIAKINSIIVPEELFLVITAPIFAGDACGSSRGTAAGEITFEVPRFVLNGAQEFAMNMSSNQTMSLAGSAMSVEGAECNDKNGGRLLRIIEVLFNANEDIYAKAIQIQSDPQSEEAGNKPSIYVLYSNGFLKKAPEADVKSANKEGYTQLTNGKYTDSATAALKYWLYINGHEDLNVVVTIPKKA